MEHVSCQAADSTVSRAASVCFGGLGEIRIWYPHIVKFKACHAVAPALLGVRAGATLENKLLLKNLAHNHLNFGSTLDRDTTMHCSVSSENWKWLVTKAQLLCTSESIPDCFVKTAVRQHHPVFFLSPPKHGILELATHRTWFC